MTVIDADDSNAYRAQLDARLDATFNKKNSAPITPSMTLYETQAEPYKVALYQDGATLYASSQDASGTIHKSTDSGGTWVTKGNVGQQPWVMTRIKATGTLIAVGSGTPNILRSTDDGVLRGPR